MPAFDASAFTAPAAPMEVWGGGHTRETDPTQNGWRCRPAYKDGPLMIGQKGVAGCATLVPYGTGCWDVAVYWETPKEVADAKCRYDASYTQIPDVPGFGLQVIELISEQRSAMAAV